MGCEQMILVLEGRWCIEKLVGNNVSVQRHHRRNLCEADRR